MSESPDIAQAGRGDDGVRAPRASGAYARPMPGSRVELYGAFDALGASGDDQRRQIAFLLGREWPPLKQKTIPSSQVPLEAPPDASIAATEATLPPVRAERTGGLDTFLLSAPTGEAGLEELGPAPVLAHHEPAAPLSKVLGGGELEFEPLLAPLQAPGLLAALLSTPYRDGPPDVPILIRSLLEGFVLKSLPRELRWSLRRGAQVLVDISDEQLGFFPDRASLLAMVRTILGDLSEVIYFRNFPDRAGAGPVRTWGPYQPPAPDVPVLLVGTFGVCRRTLDEESVARLERWLGFADLLAYHRCFLTVLTPTPPAYYPDVVTRRIPMLEWDRRTHIQDARLLRAMRAHHARAV